MEFAICFLIIFMFTGCIALRVQLSDVPLSDDSIEPINSASDENTKPIIAPWDERI